MTNETDRGSDGDSGDDSHPEGRRERRRSPQPVNRAAGPSGDEPGPAPVEGTDTWHGPAQSSLWSWDDGWRGGKEWPRDDAARGSWEQSDGGDAWADWRANRPAERRADEQAQPWGRDHTRGGATRWRREWTREEWMQYFIDDPPPPAPGHFEEEGSWES